jgi:hypothetical protein
MKWQYLLNLSTTVSMTDARERFNEVKGDISPNPLGHW